MQHINVITDQFHDEIIERKIDVKLKRDPFSVDAFGALCWRGKPPKGKEEKVKTSSIVKNNEHVLFVSPIRKVGERVEFSCQERHLELCLADADDAGLPLSDDDFKSATNFENLFWLFIKIIEKDDGTPCIGTVRLGWLPCGKGQCFPKETFEIGYGEKYLHSIGKLKHELTIKEIESRLKDEYVFDEDGRSFLFVQTYSTESNNITLHGFNRRAEVAIEDGKWVIIKEINNKRFCAKLDDFRRLGIVVYDDVNFVEKSKARIALNAIKAASKKGETLLELWRKYGEMEEKRAREFAEKIGEIKFKFVRHLDDAGTTLVRLENKTFDPGDLEELCQSSLKLLPKDTPKVEEDNVFEIKTIKAHDVREWEVYDEDEILSDEKDGIFVISTQGDLVVRKRRVRAIGQLTGESNELKESRYLLRNLRMIVEGQAESIESPAKKIKSVLSTETKKFLKENFGIEKLTENQEEAVRIALETPDIAVIQGPPGTGKTTVVAAVCHRLFELADKDRRYRECHDKTILVSAFQNDTLEHIASKIHTLGLPTIKLGRISSSVAAEDVFIEKMRKTIDTMRQCLAPQNEVVRVSAKLKKILDTHEKERDSERTRKAIAPIVDRHKTEIPEDLHRRWEEFHFTSVQKNENEVIKALNALPLSEIAYKDDGFVRVRKLLTVFKDLAQEDKVFLESAPLEDEEMPDGFFQRLEKLRDKYLIPLRDANTPISSGTDLPLLDWIKDAIKFFKKYEKTASQDRDTFFASVLESLREELDGNPEFIRESIRNHSEAIAATNQLSGGKEMADYPVQNVILEEAARSNPLDLLIPMTRASERIILIGDQKQLPHLLDESIADETSNQLSHVEDARERLKEALFGIIFRNLEKANPVRRITLNEQFRMHPHIGDFISRVYYDGKLKSGLGDAPQALAKSHKLSLPWAKGKVAVFVDVQGEEIRGKSKSNQAEAKRALRILKELFSDPELNAANMTIGIITFYAEQVKRLFIEAKKSGYATENNGEFEILPEFRTTDDGREKLRIGTVDSFQGKEFDIIILSTVRSNSIKRIPENARRVFGFLLLENRLNVAFSRAQRLLIAVGNGKMFADDFARDNVAGLHEFHTTLSTHPEYGNHVQ
ncbi:MAG: AAA family ATPase [Puniceicoccales bacterium]|jgi:DNA replication protein DnaC|nr:AAA family ATPase [Puniceicoccales bacterium]